MTDWKSTLKNLAPVLGTAIGGPLAGSAIKLLGAAIFGEGNTKTDADIQSVLLNDLSPELVLKIKQADQDFQLKLKQFDIDLVQLNFQNQNNYLLDVQNARTTLSTDATARNNVFYLGCIILLTFAIIVASAMWASFQLMTGGIEAKDPGVVATVSGLVGTVIGYVAANAQQVVSFFFGSSSGSDKKTDALTAAVRNFKQ